MESLGSNLSERIQGPSSQDQRQQIFAQSDYSQLHYLPAHPLVSLPHCAIKYLPSMESSAMTSSTTLVTP